MCKSKLLVDLVTVVLQDHRHSVGEKNARQDCELLYAVLGVTPGICGLFSVGKLHFD